MLKNLASRIPSGSTDTLLRPTNCCKSFRLQAILLSKINITISVGSPLMQYDTILISQM